MTIPGVISWNGVHSPGRTYKKTYMKLVAIWGAKKQKSDWLLYLQEEFLQLHRSQGKKPTKTLFSLGPQSRSSQQKFPKQKFDSVVLPGVGWVSGWVLAVNNNLPNMAMHRHWQSQDSFAMLRCLFPFYTCYIISYIYNIP